ncbi:MAG TPA: indole-3-glycerol phosphate synthase TrpC [Acidobacteriaceae bacterium]|nr:indole-3-glycerol phosphate synthase TrpC [Acidobacteriaceae bacterium]
MSTRLAEIVSTTRRSVAERKARVSRTELECAAQAHRPRGFAAALRRRAMSSPAIIAELKKASPSRGLIRADFDPASLAAALAGAGAAALSVLTDEPFFQGSLRNLELASQACTLPCLRKDFMVDEFQMLEARAHRADAILLIAAALSDRELSSLAAAAHALELDVLCEVHTSEELDRVLKLDLCCDAVGVNNRDLKTFDVRLDISLELASRLPPSAVHVAESGIHSAADIARLRAAGFHAFLIGESLMRQPDPAAAIAGLLSPEGQELRGALASKE